MQRGYLEYIRKSFQDDVLDEIDAKTKPLLEGMLPSDDKELSLIHI